MVRSVPVDSENFQARAVPAPTRSCSYFHGFELYETAVSQAIGQAFLPTDEEVRMG